MIIYYLKKKKIEKNKIYVVSNFGILLPVGFEPITLEVSTYLPSMP